MFGNVFRLELRRSCSPIKLIVVTLGLVVLLLMSSWADFLSASFPGFRYQDTIGAVNILHFIQNFDRFKVLMVFCLGGLHTASFCKDDNSNFLRILLSRTDITIYAQCRFITNVIAILISCEVSFFLFVILLLPLFPVLSIEAATPAFYYLDIAVWSPFVYVGMMGLQFGMIVSACSSIGLWFSAYQSNAFVSIGISGLVFFIAISYLPLGTPVDILSMMGMLPVLGRNHYWQANYMWGILLPSVIIALCGFGFYRRLKWRKKHGYI